MPNIHIITAEFDAAPTLLHLLARRRVAAVAGLATAPIGTAAMLVCSLAHATSRGGVSAITDIARAAGAKSVVIVAENAPAFLVTPELGGRLLRLALPVPHPGQPVCRDAALLMLADIVGGQSSAMVAADPVTGQLIDLAARVARTDVTVFINGPTGSGKEILAREVHAGSRRAAEPFVAINCAAIPENMLEAVLFGHEKGAFTGASGANKGIIRAAEGGSLLLDEVSEMPLGLQAKLLRVLQERTVTPLGSQKDVAVDIRIIATSNCDMRAEVAARRFREDLFYRLNVFPLATCALVERPDDIAALAIALIRRHCPKGSPLPLPTPEAMTMLMQHDWPGNVRELENVMQRALVLHDGACITPDDIVIDAGTALVAALPRAIFKPSFATAI